MLLPNDLDRPYCKIPKEIWNWAVLKSGFQFWYEMPEELFYFYHIAHMAKHFELGGCGIRPFMDLWILDKTQRTNRQKQDALLEQGGLLKFSNAARQLSRVWFAGEEHTEITGKMERYILKGGTFGTMENRVVMAQQRMGGKVKYLLSRVFLPYDVLSKKFPCLQKHKWLTPVFQVVRWFRLFRPERSREVFRELNSGVFISERKVEDIAQLLVELSL